MSQQPPSVIPPLPPLLLVPFINYIGISQIPLMIWGFFNQRHKVRSGAEAGYRIVMKESQPIEVPENIIDLASSSSPDAPTTNFGDLDFDKGVESYYKKSLDSLHEDTEKAREKYYKDLAAKLNTARQLSRGTREPTKEELENPPPTEVELRAERLKKERRWRDDLEGWDIIKPSSNVSWDERCRSVLRIFITPKNEDSQVS
jgi:import inner membrane translocase subunit TIM54